MMHKFDLHSFFLKELQNPNEEADSEESGQIPNPNVPVPGQAPVQNAQNPQQNPPAGNQNPQNDAIKKNPNQSSAVFSSFVGSTISDIGFKKTSGNGGELSISLSKSNMPLKISWVGDKVTVTQPNGNIVSL